MTNQKRGEKVKLGYNIRKVVEDLILGDPFKSLVWFVIDLLIVESGDA